MTHLEKDMTLRAGCKAVWTTHFSGNVPCTVLAIEDRNARQAGITFDLVNGAGGSTRYRVTLRVTADRGPYRKGEVQEVSSNHVVPRACIRKGKYRHYIAAYAVEPDRCAWL